MVCKQQRFDSHGSGLWKSKIRVPAWSGSGEAPFPAAECHLLVVASHGGKRAAELFGALVIRALIPFVKALPK